jgi:hypothetical protein
MNVQGSKRRAYGSRSATSPISGVLLWCLCVRALSSCYLLNHYHHFSSCLHEATRAQPFLQIRGTQASLQRQRRRARSVQEYSAGHASVRKGTQGYCAVKYARVCSGMHGMRDRETQRTHTSRILTTPLVPTRPAQSLASAYPCVPTPRLRMRLRAHAWSCVTPRLCMRVRPLRRARRFCASRKRQFWLRRGFTL